MVVVFNDSSLLLSVCMGNKDSKIPVSDIGVKMSMRSVPLVFEQDVRNFCVASCAFLKAVDQFSPSDHVRDEWRLEFSKLNVIKKSFTRSGKLLITRDVSWTPPLIGDIRSTNHHEF